MQYTIKIELNTIMMVEVETESDIHTGKPFV